MLNGLDLFSGIGGLSIALSEWIRPKVYCEIDPYCQAVLLSNMESGLLKQSPIWDDIKTLKSELLPKIDVIYAGFPCQDISIAGNGIGLDGERSGLYWEIYRLAKEIKPKFIFLENVPAIVTRGGIQVVKSLAEIGYDCRWCTLCASQCGVPHKRERWFLLAHSKSQRCNERRQSKREEKTFTRFNDYNECKNGDNWKKGEPPMVRVDNGLSFISHRIKALGNAVVPIQAKEAFKYLLGINEL